MYRHLLLLPASHYEQGLGDPSGTLSAAPAAAAAAASSFASPWQSVGDRPGDESGAVDPGETSLVGAMVLRNGEAGVVVQHNVAAEESVCRVQFDTGELVVVAVDDMLDWLV